MNKINNEPMSYEQFYSAFYSVEGHEAMPRLYEWYCMGYKAGNNDRVRSIINLLDLKTK